MATRRKNVVAAQLYTLRVRARVKLLRFNPVGIA